MVLPVRPSFYGLRPCIILSCFASCVYLHRKNVLGKCKTCARSLYHSTPYAPSSIRLVQSGMLYGEAQSHYTYLLTDRSLELIPLPSNCLQQHNRRLMGTVWWCLPVTRGCFPRPLGRALCERDRYGKEGPMVHVLTMTLPTASVKCATA